MCKCPTSVNNSEKCILLPKPCPLMWHLVHGNRVRNGWYRWPKTCKICLPTAMESVVLRYNTITQTIINIAHILVTKVHIFQIMANQNYSQTEGSLEYHKLDKSGYACKKYTILSKNRTKLVLWRKNGCWGGKKYIVAPAYHWCHMPS